VKPYRPVYTPETQRDDSLVSQCRRGCCWSPYGHSTAARACNCHDLPKPKSEPKPETKDNH
jgi:hypothetical protein